MRKFKIGDVVEVVSVCIEEDKQFYNIGDVGTIGYISDLLNDIQPYHVQFNDDNPDNTWWVAERDLKLVRGIKKESEDTRTEDEKELIQIILG